MQVGRSRPEIGKDLAWGHKYQQTEPKKTTRGWRTEDKADIEGKPGGQDPEETFACQAELSAAWSGDGLMIWCWLELWLSA